MSDIRERETRSSRNKSQSRRLPIGPIVLVVIIIVGVALWALTGPSDKSGKPKASGSATASATGRTSGPASPPSTGSAAGLPLGHLPNTTEDPKRSGPGTLDDAVKRVIVYGEEVNQLRACGATTGATQLISGTGWGAGFTEFKCTSAALAQRAVSNLGAWEKTQGFTEETPQIPQITQYRRNTNPSNPPYPIQVHLRYVSGSTVVGIIVQAQRAPIAALAVTTVLGASASTFPPG